MTLQDRWAQKVRDRNQKVLEAAIGIARAGGYNKITRDGVAAAAGVSAGCVNLAYGTVAQLRDEVMRFACDHEDLVILAQGLAHGHEIARSAPPSLRNRALASLK